MHFLGEIIGCDDEGELYKSLVCFKEVGLKESIPYVTKSSPKTNIDADWLKTELLDSSKFFLTAAFVLELLLVTIIRRMCLVSRNCWNMSNRMRMNYIYYTSLEKSTFATTLPI